MARQYGTPAAMRRLAYDPIGDANALRRFDNMSGIGAPGTPVGAYVFEIPLGFVNNMQTHDFIGYHYASGKGSYRFRVSFYAYQATPAVINATVTYDTGVPGDTLVRPQVRIGRRIATGNAVIIINDIATNTYQYPRIHLQSSWFSVTSLTETAMDTTPNPVLVTDLSPYDLIVSPSDTSPGINASNAFNQGTLPVARGGTGTSTALAPGGIVYGVNSGAMTTGPAGTSGQFLTSNGAAAPTWTTPPSYGLLIQDEGTPLQGSQIQNLNVIGNGISATLTGPNAAKLEAYSEVQLGGTTPAATFDLWVDTAAPDSGSWPGLQTTSLAAQTNTTVTTVVAAGTTVLGGGFNLGVDGPGDIYMCWAVMDVQNAGATAINGIGELYVGGVYQSGQILVNQGTQTLRGTYPGIWLVTGLTAGTTNFDLRYRITVAGNHLVSATHTKLVVLRVA